ncbi:hypothetical protein F4X88_00400 [Candidatus Poribacteria bacterium]|nr:hypothetical protein [Candidatus Poribacteria bacterium]
MDFPGYEVSRVGFPAPYQGDFKRKCVSPNPGRILNRTVKEAFLQILHDIEENQADPEKYLQAMFSSLINLMAKSQVDLNLFQEIGEASTQISQTDAVTIDNIVNLLEYHLWYWNELLESLL